MTMLYPNLCYKEVYYNGTALYLFVYYILQTMAIVAHTLVDLVKNLQSFGGIIVVRLFSYHIHTR